MHNGLSDNGFMSELGKTIRAKRLARGMTQAELGAHFDVTKSAVNQWESGVNVPDQRKLAGLVQILGLDPAVAAGVDTIGPAEQAVTPPPAQRMQPEPPREGKPDVPVWASAEAGEDGAIVLTPDPIDYVHRSERLLGVRNPFAFYVVGNSMSPAIKHGDQVVVNPSLPVRPGAECVFIHDDGNGQFLAVVKELLRVGPTSWKVRQHTPAKDYELPKRKWSRAHVIAEIRRGGL